MRTVVVGAGGTGGYFGGLLARAGEDVTFIACGVHPTSGKSDSPKLNYRFTEFSEVHKIPIGSLRAFSESPAKVCLFRGSAIVPTISFFLSRAPKRDYLERNAQQSLGHHPQATFP